VVSRKEFARKLAELDLSHVDRAVAFLWYYRETQEFDERSGSDLAADLHDEDFPHPNVTRLRKELQRSAFTIQGKRKGTFQIDARKLVELTGKYASLIGTPTVHVQGAILPPEWVAGTRKYFEQMVFQINGCYEVGFYDGCAALSRRLMESLIIEVYVCRDRHREIQNNGTFLQLDGLINYIVADKTITLSRNSPKAMQEVKQLGDTAAHDRVYITPQIDIDDTKVRYRHLIQELLNLSGIKKT
jgi:hypothetical protein